MLVYIIRYVHTAQLDQSFQCTQNERLKNNFEAENLSRGWAWTLVLSEQYKNIVYTIQLGYRNRCQYKHKYKYI